MSFTKLIRATAGAMALAFVAATATAQLEGKPENKQDVLDKVTLYLTRSAFVPGIDFAKWPEFLEENRANIDAAATDDDFQRAVNTALSKFGASHIVLTTPKQAQTRISGAVVGIGITSQLTEEGYPLVVRVVKDAPAMKAGLVPGDIIVEVDGAKAEGTKGIAGEEGTPVKLKILREKEEKEFSIVRAKFSTIRPEELAWVKPDVAKLTVHTFDLSYDRKNVEKLMLEAAKAKTLIVDLRDNGGGAVINLEHLLGLLMNPEQPIGTFISRSMVKKYVEATKGDPNNLGAVATWATEKIRPMRNPRVAPFTGDLMVFVNGLSGSASEIAAAALQETSKAKVIGTKSAGAVLVSIIVPASHGFMIQYPLSDYVTLRGRRLEGNGVIPDIEAKDPLYRLPNAKDACVEAALSLLTTAKAGTGGK